MIQLGMLVRGVLLILKSNFLFSDEPTATEIMPMSLQVTQGKHEEIHYFNNIFIFNIVSSLVVMVHSFRSVT